MGNRGQKRMEMAVDLPDDKRACSSLDFRPSTSNSSVQTHLNSTNSTPETHHNDMDTSSSASASSRSEEEPEKDAGYGSCDSDDAEPRHRGLRELQRRRSSSDHGKLRSILACLSEDTDPSGQITSLTELCEVLSFAMEDSLSSMMADSLSPVLVKLARHETNPDIMLLAVRAITYLCDIFPRSSGLLVRHDAVPALCQRLKAIEYLDVAEQCLQALEKISRDQPHACLEGGAIMAALTYIDFFSTSIQRVALSTVANICKKLPSECPSHLMEAVPILSNLLQYEDRQLVESVAICLIKIAEQLSQSSQMLDELCSHGLINQTTHLLNLNSRTTLSQPIYYGLIGLLVKISSGSIVAFKMLYELNIGSVLKDILSTYDLSHGMSSPYMVDGHCNQVHEVLKLLNELLPTSVGDQCVQLVLDKQSFLVDRPDLLQNFGMDILPMLIQVVNSGANIFVCYGCLSVINKLVYLSKSDMLIELLKSANIPSFLAGVFTRKDHHVVILALEIAEMILQKLSDTFLNSFVKEGVFFAIDALLTPEKCSQLFPAFSGIQLCPSSSQKCAGREVLRCLCYAFDTGLSSSASEKQSCKLDKDSVHNLAKSIITKYFSPELFGSDKGLTDILQDLRSFSAVLTDLMNVCTNNEAHARDEEKFYCILHQIMEKLNGREPVSTFEFIESGIVKSLVTYLTNGLYLRDNAELHIPHSDLFVVEKRFEVLARLLLPYSDNLSEDSLVSALIQKLQSALSSLEIFPVILSHSFKLRSSYATVPYGRCISHPCLRVRFVRGDGETCLSDFSEDLLTVDPFSSLEAIEGYLWPKVTIKESKDVESDCLMDQMNGQPLHLSSNSKSILGESSESMEHESTSAVLTPVKHDSISSTSGVPKMQDCKIKLTFDLDGQKLERTLTLYQAILQKQIKTDGEVIAGAKLWSQVYTIIYRRAMESKCNDPKNCVHLHPMSLYQMEMRHVCIVLHFSPACLLVNWPLSWIIQSLEGMNRLTCHLISHERIRAYAEGRFDNLDDLKVAVHSLRQNDFVNSKLTEKLEQQMRDSAAVSTGGVPSWCNQLMASCPFLFSFEARCKYFQLAAFAPRQVQPHPLYRSNSGAPTDRRSAAVGLPRKKFLVCRNRILESATQMMDQHARNRTLLEVEYDEEVGSGLGPTLEFYTLVSHEFQKSGMSMWRDDHSSVTVRKSLEIENSDIVMSPFGLFPCPWSAAVDTSYGIQFSDVLKKVLDLPFSKAFYKLILGKVFPIEHLKIFTEEELERLFCGERDFLAFNDLLDHIKFDHGYTASSPPILNLLEIIREFDYDQRRAFLQFVTGAPRLPPGGLASLNPKLTIVRKHCSNCADADLPSVMTCANYLKLPPYSSKEMMKEKLLYAITEGQGSFHLS
ncbi:hypothetical protein CUMW_141130 [Citrus unshiu]|nr:hypothetical protein CUMW_141130 [Citrus unshiu]GAY52354.1 hypothetical protein CUMW_141130 [Citrus unshiu]